MKLSFQKISKAEVGMDALSILENINLFSHIWFANVGGKRSGRRQKRFDIMKQKIHDVIPEAVIHTKLGAAYGEVVVYLKNDLENAQFVVYADAGAFDP